MERWPRFTTIMVFALLLAAGLNYAGRSMHRTLGGDKKHYTFFLPDLKERRLLICGRSYQSYQAAALWERGKMSTSEWLNALLPGLQKTGSTLEALVKLLLSSAKSFALDLKNRVTFLLRSHWASGLDGRLPIG